MPDIIGSTTFSVAATATAASKALPPASRMSSPACVANGWAELTIPRLPTAGRAAVLRLAGWSGCAVARPAAPTNPPSTNATCTHLVMAWTPQRFLLCRKHLPAAARRGSVARQRPYWRQAEAVGHQVVVVEAGAETATRTGPARKR